MCRSVVFEKLSNPLEFLGKDDARDLLFEHFNIGICCGLDSSALSNLQGKMAERLRRVTQAF
jgi:hypothetical protein